MGGEVGNLSGNIGATCLHLGRSGQRCWRPAQEDGFCSSHGPGVERRVQLIASRRLIAVTLGFVVLWPIFEEFWREIDQLWHPGR